MTNDHMAEVDGEKERILSAGGYVNDGRVMDLILTSRSLGDFEYK